ncbi:ATP-dependent DNA helicase PcrA [Hypsizygus marmoreus]|uniref:DNA 3'-5' helicase n=1 Tax=Hypsizygus marmoreus TaxID=39966 RepID=A0A369JWU8_HYPMA|nr:ATP-dependent DNA helicase PcrA [Hypsizygus marmoreus]
MSIASSSTTHNALIPSTSSESFLAGLNPAQLKAVQHPPEVPVQILAGPGSGKTKVLTSRIAHLILTHSISPSSICAVTFTNKAANEMRERLIKLIGKQRTTEMKMGTFHSLCALFLRKYGTLAGLEGNFTICDADECKKTISTILKTHKAFLEEKNISLKEGTVLSMISKAKAKGQSATDYSSELQSKSRDAKKAKATAVTPNDIEYLVAQVYEDYERTLRRNNSLDFDDLLLYGVKLFRKHKHTVAWCKHVLVDEFQDTNITQYELMSALALNRCVTVVGDPDQSIYGWRSAEVENLAKMRKDFCGTEQIFLEQNYRSTASILRTSLAVVAQDKARIQKTLHTAHPIGTTPVLRSLPTEYAEAAFIAVEIKRLVAHMGGVLRWGDFGVLLRFNALSRAIESALQREGIPSRVLGGHKFFERLEIKNLLAYLQLIDNTNFDPALVRAANVPSRGIGEKTLLEIAARAEKTKVSQLTVIEGICDGRLPDIKPTAKRKLVPFVKTVRALRDLANQGTSPANLIRRLIDLVDFESHLRKTQPDWESRWENVQELITFASEFDTDIPYAEPSTEENSDTTTAKDTPLRLFLQASMLSSEGDNQSEEDSKEKVTISTCHAAKGLEWPVVIIPAVEQGTFPFYRSEDIEEERRLLYVACTRAQGLLYLSHVEKRKVAGDTKSKELSEFISVITKQNPTLFTSWQPDLSPVDRRVISTVLNRPNPDESEVSRRIAEFDRVMRNHVMNYHQPPAPQALSHPVVAHPGADINFIPSRNMLSTGLPANNIGISQPQPHRSAPIVTLPSVTPLYHPTIASTRTTVTLSKPTSFTLTPGSSTTLLNTRHMPPRNENIPPQTRPFQTIHSPTSSTETPCQASSINEHVTNGTSLGTKRRLGMGRGAVGYANKKFKPPR